MKITILGAGNGGTTVAADLTRKGHEVTLCKTSTSMHNEHFNKIISSQTIKVFDLEETYSIRLFKVTDNLTESIPDADLIIVYIQTNYHEALIKRIAPLLRDGQFVLFEPGALSTCYMMEYCDKVNVTVIEAESSPIDCRIEFPGAVRVLFKNVLNPFAVFPKNNIDEAELIIKQLGYGYRFLDSVVESALHNPNLIVHTVGSIFSIPRIEYSKGEYWMYKEVFTPHIWNIVEALDKEKMKVLAELGFPATSYVDACQERNFTNDERSAVDAFFDYAMNHSPKGPVVPDSRYITEDVPQGLVLLESLASLLKIETPVCTALINCASAALKVDWREQGRTVDKLGEKHLNRIISNNLGVSIF